MAVDKTALLLGVIFNIKLIMKIQKYLQVFKIAWQNTLVYRLNFLVARFRAVVMLMSIYLFWLAVYKTNGKIAGYDKKTMLTYILGTTIMQSLILGSRSQDFASDIASGKLSNLLLKPIHCFNFLLSRDIADKIINVFSAFLELGSLYFLFKPELFVQKNLFYLFYFVVFSVLGVILFFNLSLLISLFAFWYPEHNGWPARFLFMTIIRFLSGGLLPLDVFPYPIYKILQILPSTYLRFFPLQVYLGRVDPSKIYSVLFLMTAWIVFLKIITKVLFKKGLKNYTAAGI